jgi:hypothetical protein
VATKTQPWSIKRQQDSTFELRAPYRFTFKEDLKETVPAEDREYDPTTKVWTIEEDYLQEVVDLCDKHFHTAVGPKIRPAMARYWAQKAGIR